MASPAPSMLYVVTAMSFNFFSSVLVITVNKIVFKEHGYNFPTFLTGLHFVVTFLGLCVVSLFGVFKPKAVALIDLIPLSLSFVGFVVFNNLSLQYNSVGFYQLMKVLTTPVIVVIQLYLFNVALSNKLKLALLPICIGVALATGADTSFNPIGLTHAILGILSTSMYQIWVKSKQQDLGLDSYQLLFAQAPASAAVVFAISFFTESGWSSYAYTVDSTTAIAVSCVLAFSVNLSIFMVIGKTSPIAYNVLGHFKLCVILLTGFLYFGEDANLVRVLGTVLTIIGVIVYTHIQMSTSNGWDKRPVQPPQPEPSEIKKNNNHDDVESQVPLTQLSTSSESTQK